MRDAARLKLGFYPVDPAALDYLTKAIELENPAESHVLDPCAGNGDAVLHLAQSLGIPPANTWAIELDAGRGEELSRRLPATNVLSPASFFGCHVKSNAFSVVYCNPPFDDLGCGTRVEQAFFREAVDLVKPGGLFVGVFPERVIYEYLKNLVMAQLEWFTVEPFPAECRPYHEAFVVGIKREEIVDPRKIDWNFCGRSAMLRPGQYRNVPPSPGPLAGRWPRWAKVLPTNDELYDLLQRSPLRKHLNPPQAETTLPRPPLSLSKGHLALMLASGYLNGLVAPEGEPPHVVRGTASKAEVEVDSEEHESKSETKTVTIYRERIQLTVRAVDASGEIRTFCS